MFSSFSFFWAYSIFLLCNNSQLINILKFSLNNQYLGGKQIVDFLCYIASKDLTQVVLVIIFFCSLLAYLLLIFLHVQMLDYDYSNFFNCQVSISSALSPNIIVCSSCISRMLLASSKYPSLMFSLFYCSTYKKILISSLQLQFLLFPVSYYQV